MNDLIARARETWCRWGSPEREGDLIPGLARKLGLERYYRNTYVPCPPEVVAALLDVLEKLNEFDVRLSHGGREALQAEAAIAKALEEK